MVDISPLIDRHRLMSDERIPAHMEREHQYLRNVITYLHGKGEYTAHQLNRELAYLRFIPDVPREAVIDGIQGYIFPFRNVAFKTTRSIFMEKEAVDNISVDITKILCAMNYHNGIIIHHSVDRDKNLLRITGNYVKSYDMRLNVGFLNKPVSYIDIPSEWSMDVSKLYDIDPYPHRDSEEERPYHFLTWVDEVPFTKMV